MGDRINAHFPWLLMMILITIESSLTGFELPPLGLEIEDKLIHALVFGVLGWLIARGFHLEKKPVLNRHFVTIAIVLGLAFAVSDEFHQSLVSGRDADVLDLVADWVGILFFVWYYKKKMFLKTNGKKSEAPASTS